MSYRITAFAEKCGVNKETIRYYEQKNYYKNLPERKLVIGYIQMMMLSVYGLLNGCKSLVFL